MVTKYTDATKSRVKSKEERRFPVEADWDHYNRRDYTDWFPDGTMVGETDRIGGWTGNEPKKKSHVIKTYGYVRVEFPGSSYFRGTTVEISRITINEDGTITLTTFTGYNTNGSPTGGITTPISPPGPPQAWAPSQSGN